MKGGSQTFKVRTYKSKMAQNCLEIYHVNEVRAPKIANDH